MSVKPGQAHLAYSAAYVKTFAGVSLGGHRVEISALPQPVPAERLPLPCLRYHNGSVLDPLRDLPRYPKLRSQRLRAAATNHELVIDTQHLLIPTSIHRHTGDIFRDHIEQTLRSLTGSQHLRVDPVVYDPPQRRSTQAHLDTIRSTLRRANITGAALLILPLEAPPDLHNALKAELLEWRFQCIAAETVIKHFPSQGRQRAPGIAEHTCLGLMLANRLYPYSLHRRLHGDIHVGVDIRNQLAAFVFVADGGRRVMIETIPVTAGERLHTGAVKGAIVKGLQALVGPLELHSPHVVYHRDGRAFSNELDGLRAALNSLIDDGLITAQGRFSVVELLKRSSMPVRLYRNGDQAPALGDFLILDASTGVIVLTGTPFTTPGTPKPLLIHVRSGDYSIDHALSDVLALAQLAYQAPGAALGLPATVKLADDLVTERGSDYDVDGARYGSDEEELPTTTVSRPRNG